MSESELKVIFIGGSGRSGSTLLDRILGQIEGFFSLGEMYHIWERSFIENQLCGCGKPFRKCEFWNTVVQEAFGGFHKIDVYRVLRLQRSVARIRYVPYLAFPRLRSKSFNSKLEEYIGILDHLYKTIAKVSGCNVLIDSSKAPSHGFVLSEIPNMKLYVIHLVRDSRAVVYSWQRKKRRPEIYWKEAYMPRYGLIKANWEWELANLLTNWLKGKVKKNYRMIKYESLAETPKDTTMKILEWIGENSSNLTLFKNETNIILNVNHTVSGNPIRFKQGKVKVKLDIEWKKSLPLFYKLVTTFITMPFLKKYGYSLNWGAYHEY